MKINFTKMHGAGNDYIYMDCFHQPVPEDPSSLAVKMSCRRFSVGADGLVLICPCEGADAEMRMFNADGSEGAMCGNASRCIGKFLYESGICKKDTIRLLTKSGVRTLLLHRCGETVRTVTVDMGYASFEPCDIPALAEREMVNTALTVDGEQYTVSCLSVGNPHCVVFVDDPESVNLEHLGPLFEHHPLFPRRINTEFVSVTGDNALCMRVYERGSGETLACGTGAVASAAAAIRTGHCRADEPVRVKLRGGELSVSMNADGCLFLTGTAEKCYDGVYEYED